MEAYERDQRNKANSAHIKKAETVLAQIEKYEEQFRSQGTITKEKMSAMTNHWKAQLKNIEPFEEKKKALEKIMPAAMALAKIATEEYHPEHIILRDTQMLTAIALFHGTIAELGTGEGKTLTAIPFAYAYSLLGDPVHITTTNSMLSSRDQRETNIIAEALGLRSAYIPDEVSKKEEKRQGYSADWVYASNSTLAFDYGRDQRATDASQLVQTTKASVVLIDETDDILLDGSRVPYLISETAPVFIGSKTYNEDYEGRQTIEDLAKILKKDPNELMTRARNMTTGRLQKDLYSSNLKTPIEFEMASIIAERCYNMPIERSKMRYHLDAEDFISDIIFNNTVLNNVIYECEEGTIIPGMGNKKYSATTIYNLLTGQVDATTAAEKEFVEKTVKKHSLIINESGKNYNVSNDFLRTTEGYFYYSTVPEARELINRRSQEIINIGGFQENVDYVFDKGKFQLTDSGAALAASINLASRFPEIQKSFEACASGNNKLIGQVLRIMDEYVVTALDAHIKHADLKDYYVDKKDNKVKLINAGRSADGRVFGDGLQAAIECKERKAGRKIVFNPETKPAYQISQRAYFETYKIKAGMTGTSSDLGFSALYGMQTIEIPRYTYYDYHSERRKKLNKTLGRIIPLPNTVKNHPDKFCSSEKEKFELIYQSILEAQRKPIPQPVLLTTLSVEESDKLEAFLLEKHITPTKLNVMNEKEEEAKIIARAGYPGAITIVTELAGRGTDIKLGGDRQGLIKYIKELTDVDVESAFAIIDKQEKAFKNRFGRDILPDEYEALIRDLEAKEIIPKMPQEAFDTVPSLAEESALNKALSKQGGLRILGSGHFPIERIDDQLKGRTGRSGAGGETQFFSTREDFLRMGADKRTTHRLFDEIEKNKGTSKKIDRELKKLIKSTQGRQEIELFQVIKQKQDIDLSVAGYRRKLEAERLSIVKNIGPNGEQLGSDELDCSYIVDQMIEDSVRDFVVLNTKNSVKSLSYDLMESGLDVDTFILEMKDAFGLQLTPEYVANVPSLKALKDEIAISVQARHRRELELDPKGQRQRDIELVLTNYDRTMQDSLEIAEASMLTGAMAMQNGIQNQFYAPGYAVNFFKDRMEYAEREIRNRSMRFNFGMLLQDEEYVKLDRAYEARLAREVGSGTTVDNYQRGEYDYFGMKNDRSEAVIKEEQPGVTNLHIREAMKRLANEKITMIPVPQLEMYHYEAFGAPQISSRDLSAKRPDDLNGGFEEKTEHVVNKPPEKEDVATKLEREFRQAMLVQQSGQTRVKENQTNKQKSEQYIEQVGGDPTKWKGR